MQPSFMTITPRHFATKRHEAEDEENIPETHIEDRALGIAQTHHKNDVILNEILNKELSLSGLQSYYNSHYQSLHLLHHCYVLYRANKLFVDIKRRSSMSKEDKEAL